MSAGRDELWVDMTQFDARVADGVWDGAPPDSDAPGWFADVRALVHRARGPAEPDELVDEPVLVDRMRRATLGETIAELPHRPGVRTLGRLVTMKAAAATTASVMTMAAAAATTGIVATVAATVVVPAIQERVMPIIGHEAPPAAEAPAPTDAEADGTPGAATPPSCAPDEDDCDRGNAESVANDAPGKPSPATEASEPAPATDPAAPEPAGSEPEPADESTTTTTTAPAETTSTTDPPTATSTPVPPPMDEAPSPAAAPGPPSVPDPGRRPDVSPTAAAATGSS
jgi:hypothetical protein